MGSNARLASILVAILASANARADAPVPLHQTQVIPLPGVEKRIDHMAIDTAGKRLFVSALGNGTLEVIDLQASKRVGSTPGLEEPQGIAFLPKLHKVVVANGGGTVVAFEDPSFKLLATIPAMDDADNVRTDSVANLLYVGYGAGALAVIDPITMKRVGDIKLPGHPESFQLERAGPRVYVNVPRTNEVVIVDRQKRTVISRMQLVASARNYPMSLDEGHHRLFVGARAPARLLVFDTQSGKQVAAVPCVGDTDDLFYDSARDRVYVIGGEGFVEVFDVTSPDRPVRLARLSTASGARTGLWSPELRQLYVAAPRQDGHEAAIRVYETAP